MAKNAGLSRIPRAQVWAACVRAWPTAMTLAPIAMLCGALAAQAGWRVAEVLFFSALGFSGSGQFALLSFAGQGAGVMGAMLSMTISVNSRYIPIALASASRLPATPVFRAFAAHMLGDEAYALENERDGVASVITLRATIYVVWICANTAGALVAGWIPHGLGGAGINLGFPASVVLLVLSLGQIRARVPRIPATWRRRIIEIALCAGVSVGLFALLGKVWFWLPGIAFSAWRIWQMQRVAA